MIVIYFQKIENLIKNFSKVLNYDITTKIYDENFGSITGQVLFTNFYKLEFLELVDTENNLKDKYRYHLMDNQNNLLFRYDNSKHHKHLKTFPHHKHIDNKVTESNEPTFFDILSEINLIITK